MTPDQITKVVGQLREAAVPAEWSSDREETVALHVRPLDYVWAARNAARWAVEPKIDRMGAEVPKFLTALTDVLEALGVPAAARGELARAAATPGAELVPDLRSPTGLSYVGPNDPLPRGAAEWLLLNERPLPPRPVALDPPEQLALPGTEPPPTVDESKEVIRNIVARRVPRPATSAKVEEVGDLLHALARNPDLPDEVVEAVKRLAYRSEAQVSGLADQMLAYRDRCDELDRMIVGAEENPETLVEAVGRIGARLQRTPEGRALLGSALDSLVARMLPGLTETRVRFVRADPYDPTSPVIRCVADFRKPDQRPPKQPPKRAPASAGSVPTRLGDAVR